MQTDTIGVAVGIIGIMIGIIVSYYFYRKSIRAKEPCWAIRSNNLIQGYNTQLDDLRVFYKSRNVENLTISKVLFWNDGQDTIDRRDIETANHIRIVPSEGVKLLDARILASNNQSSRFAVELIGDGDCANMDFDYLDPKQGAVMQIVHTGKSSRDIQVIGDIKGAKALRDRLTTFRWLKVMDLPRATVRRFARYTPMASIVIGLTYIGLSILTMFRPKILSPTVPSTPSNASLLSQWALVIVFSAGGCLMIFLGSALMRLRGLAPKGLEAFHEDRF